jgi:hypothetical protein
MSAFDNLLSTATKDDLWEMHNKIVSKIRDFDSCEVELSVSSSKRGSRKLNDLLPLCESILKNNEPCSISSGDNIVNVMLCKNDEGDLLFYHEDGSTFKNPSTLATYHSNQITPGHPIPTKPCNGWNYIKVDRLNKSIGQLLSSFNENKPIENTVVSTAAPSGPSVPSAPTAAKKKTPMSDEMRQKNSDRSKKWAKAVQDLLVTMRKENPSTSYLDAQKALKNIKKDDQSDTLSTVSSTESVETTDLPYTDKDVLDYLRRTQKNSNNTTSSSKMLEARFGMSTSDATRFAEIYK